MIRVGPRDTTELIAFPLKWRWTDDRYAKLSAEELARIRPLTPEKADEIWRLSLKTVSRSHDFEVDSSGFERSERISTRTDARPWLSSRLPRGRVQLVVSWQPETAVLTDAELFTARWDDFCYPASDDVTVFPLDETWVLHYWHEEEFLYAKKRGTG